MEQSKMLIVMQAHAVELKGGESTETILTRLGLRALSLADRNSEVVAPSVDLYAELADGEVVYLVPESLARYLLRRQTGTPETRSDLPHVA